MVRITDGIGRDLYHIDSRTGKEFGHTPLYYQIQREEQGEARRKRRWFNAAEMFAVIPIMLAMFPFPLAVPIVIIGMCIEQPEETPLAIIYFSWLVIGLLFTLYTRNKYDR